MTREFLQSLQAEGQPLPEEVIDAILDKAAAMRLGFALDAAITRAKGRNPKAITALLDLEALKGSDDPAAQLDTALADLKKDCGYLFEEEAAPPPYARGTGAQTGQDHQTPATLATALRERFEKHK